MDINSFFSVLREIWGNDCPVTVDYVNGRLILSRTDGQHGVAVFPYQNLPDDIAATLPLHDMTIGKAIEMIPTDQGKQ